MSNEDESMMREALAEARIAREQGEVPVGCVVVYEGGIIARGFNRREAGQDPTAHAEMIALRDTARQLGQWRLTGVTLYVTLEPCAMCAGAMVLSRVARVVYGCADSKAGACGSVFDILREPRLNHQPEVKSGLMEIDCQDILKNFFAERRGENRALDQ